MRRSTQAKPSSPSQIGRKTGFVSALAHIFTIVKEMRTGRGPKAPKRSATTRFGWWTPQIHLKKLTFRVCLEKREIQSKKSYGPGLSLIGQIVLLRL